MKSLILRYLGFVPYFFTLERLQDPSLHIKKKPQPKTKAKKQVNSSCFSMPLNKAFLGHLSRGSQEEILTAAD